MDLRCRLRGLGAALVTVIVSGPVAATPAAAAAGFTWSGAGTSTNWSDAGNWVGGSAPSGSVGTLTFPAVGSGGGSVDDIAGLSANALSIDDSVPYGISGSALTLGAGGISAAPTSHDGGFAVVGNDIILGQPQTWAIAGDGQATGAGLEFLGSIIGGSDLMVNLTNNAHAFMRDVGVGTMTIDGSGVLTAPPFSSFNANSDHPVIVEGGASLRAYGDISLGRLSLSGGALSLDGGFGGPPASAGTVMVNGSVTLDGASSVFMTVGSSFSPPRWPIINKPQIKATGPIELNHAHFALVPWDSCPIFSPGQQYTLVTTTGQLTGQFADIPDGKLITLGPSCPGSTQSLRINYGPHTVVATVVDPGPAPSAIGVSSSPERVVTNQPTTLTVTITADYGTPQGTVNLTDVSNSGNLPECVNLRVVAAGSTGSATCRTSLAAAGDAGSQHYLAAGFQPSDGTTRSSNNILGMVVDPAATRSAVVASRPSVPVGGRVTYIATITPAYLGAVVPSGALEFDDHGVPIGSCRARPLSPNRGTATASCTVTYTAPGAHTVTARYAGDANFVGSTSRPTTVTSWSVRALGAQLTPSNPRTARRVLLRHGRLGQRIAAGTAGTLTVRWYVTTFSGKRPHRTLLARGQTTYMRSGRKTIDLMLTPAGRALLNRSRRTRVTASAVFVPRHASPVVITRSFVLR